MTEKAGKLSLIFAIIFIPIILILCIVFKNFHVVTWPDSVYYPYMGLVPLCIAFFCIILAFIFAFIGNKKKKDENVKKNNLSVFFGTYIILWILFCVFVAVGSFVFFKFNSTNPEYHFFNSVLICALAALCAIIIGIFVWATCNTWKNNKFISIIIAIITLFTFTAAVVGTAIACYVSADTFNDDDSNHMYDFNDDEYLYEEDEITEDEEIDNRNDYDRAYHFMNFRLNPENSYRAVELVRTWQLYSLHARGEWQEDQYSPEDFSTYTDFENCSSSFYNLYNESIDNADELMNICDYYVGNISPRLSRKVYEKSGARECVKALLTVHDDVYSLHNHEQILEDMYVIMNEDVPEAYEDDIMVSCRYPGLREFMSDETLEKIKNTDNYTTEWQNDFFAAWAYSFWARRYNDGVDKAAFKILKTIDNLYN